MLVVDAHHQAVKPGPPLIGRPGDVGAHFARIEPIPLQLNALEAEMGAVFLRIGVGVNRPADAFDLGIGRAIPGRFERAPLDAGNFRLRVTDERNHIFRYFKNRSLLQHVENPFRP